MIKKIVVLSLVLTLLCSAGVMPSSADGLASFVNPVVDQRTDGGCVVVKGEIDTDTANTTIVFRIIEEKEVQNPENPDENIEIRTDRVVDFTTSYRDGDKVKFDFGTIYLPGDLESNDYIVEISGMNVKKYVSIFPYVIPSEMLDLLADIKSATETEGASVGPIIAEGLNANKLALDISGYNSLNNDNDALAAFESIMKSVSYESPSGIEDGVGIDREKAKITEAYTPAVAAGKLMLIEENSTAGWDEWYNAYYNLLGFDDETDKSEDKRVTPYLEAVKSYSNFKERIYKADENLNPKQISIERIKDYLYQSALLSSIYYAKSDSYVLDILENFSDEYFSKDNWSLDWDLFEDISSVKQGEVISDIRGQNFTSCKDVVDEFNNLVEEYNSSKNSSSSSSGGSGGFGGSGGSKKSGQVVMPPQTQQKAEIFPDIVSVEWARDAIEHLHAKAIIKGNSDGTFAPNKNVTRAEFIKMVVEAMGIGDIAEDIPFKDVGEDRWYAGYIAKAYKEGIVLGDGSGNFNPDNPITRQDMVVILHRAFKDDEKGEADFVDSDLISEYARDAVGYFASAGIVNGYDDGRFAPHEYATRAQTAVILYRLMTK